MSLINMLKLLKAARRPIGTSMKDYYSTVAKAAYDPKARENISAAYKKHTDPYKTVSTPGEFFETLLFKGKRAKKVGYKEALRREQEGSRSTAQRIFGSGFDDIVPEEAAARAALGDTKTAATLGASQASTAEGAAKETFERTQGAYIRQSAHTSDYQNVENARNAYHNSRANTLLAQHRGAESVKTAQAGYDTARSKSGALLTKAVEDFDATGAGRPFMGVPNWIINHPKTIMGAAAIPYIANVADSTAGYAIGGPGYGGAVGWGEGQLGGRNNVFQGANVNMNFQAQAMGYQELTASSILPQGSTGTAPMMSRRMGRQFQDSAQGLTFGLHKGRHGGY